MNKVLNEKVLNETKNVLNESRLVIPKRYSFAKLLKKFGFLFSCHLNNKLNLEVVQDGSLKEIITMREIHKFKNGDYILEIAIQNKLQIIHRSYYYLNDDGSIKLMQSWNRECFVDKFQLKNNNHNINFSGVGLNIEPDMIRFDEENEINLEIPIGDIINNSDVFMKVISFVRIKGDAISMAPEWGDMGYYLTDLELIESKLDYFNACLKKDKVQIRNARIFIKSIKIDEELSILCFDVLPYDHAQKSLSTFKVLRMEKNAKMTCTSKLINYQNNLKFLEDINQTVENLILKSLFNFRTIV